MSNQTSFMIYYTFLFTQIGSLQMSLSFHLLWLVHQDKCFGYVMSKHIVGCRFKEYSSLKVHLSSKIILKIEMCLHLIILLIIG